MIHASNPVMATPIVAVRKPRTRLLVMADVTALSDKACRKLSRVKFSAAGDATASLCTQGKARGARGSTADSRTKDAQTAHSTHRNQPTRNSRGRNALPLVRTQPPLEAA